MKGLLLSNGPSKLLDRKWRLEQAEKHKQKIRNVKSSIREQYQSAPKTNARNGKREAMMERK